MNPILELKEIHKWAGEGDRRIDVLRGVTLSINPGEYVAIMGPSGSGKSTLLNLMGLLDYPSAGTLRLLGHDLSHYSEDALAVERSRSIGFIFQSFNLLSYLTVQQNVELPLAYRHDTSHPPETARTLLQQVNLEHRAQAYPATLSGGERQRVAIARALANHPALLLADEPTGALDSRTGAQIMELIGALNRDGAAVVVVTHDEAVARRAQRILHMRDGRFE